jgi:hypothetical protein
MPEDFFDALSTTLESAEKETPDGAQPPSEDNHIDQVGNGDSTDHE